VLTLADVRYRVSLSDFTVDADTPEQAQVEAVQTVVESPDLFIVHEINEPVALPAESQVGPMW